LSVTRIDANTTSGYNYREVLYYVVNGTEYRDLYKRYSIRFIFLTSGSASKTDYILFLLNFGSIFGIYGLALAGATKIVQIIFCIKPGLEEGEFRRTSQSIQLEKTYA